MQIYLKEDSMALESIVGIRVEPHNTCRRVYDCQVTAIVRCNVNVPNHMRQRFARKSKC